MESAACIRMSTPIRINESPRESIVLFISISLTNVDVVPGALERFTHILLPASTSKFDQAERDRTWW